MKGTCVIFIEGMASARSWDGLHGSPGGGQCRGILRLAPARPLLSTQSLCSVVEAVVRPFRTPLYPPNKDPPPPTVLEVVDDNDDLLTFARNDDFIKFGQSNLIRQRRVYTNACPAPGLLPSHDHAAISLSISPPPST